MPSRATERIVAVRLEEPDQGDLFGAGPRLIREALIPGRPTERFGRIWHVGKVHEEGGVLYGRLGYEERVRVDRWQEEVNDFERDYVDGGTAAPFVIRMSDLTVVYQPRKGAIRPESFAGALRAMLKFGQNSNWRVKSLTGGSASFDEWRGRIDRVTRLRACLEGGGEQTNTWRTGQLLAGPRPDQASVEWRASDGLDTNASCVRELLQQADAGTVEIVAEGQCGDSADTAWRWNSSSGDERMMTKVEVDNIDGEVSREALIAELEKIGRLG
ncbi:hypothetical protein [Dactylosporangium sp. CA-139066]|uniref:hypothetical protein n=1 Tax=Dactylosporangium sp. CA-139066 TaxID=3239930 RepID=UPI003D8FFA54